MKPKVLITVEKGMIQSVDSNTDIDIVIVDYDSQDYEKPYSLFRGPQDNIFKNGESYKLIDEDEVVEYLKHEHF